MRTSGKGKSGDPKAQLLFMKIINKLSSSKSSEKNFLTDGRQKYSYQEIPVVFARIERVFAKAGISIDNCLAMECDNSVHSALVMLYLLEGGYSFLLLPKLKKDRGYSLPIFGQGIPKLCRYKITTARVPENNNVDNIGVFEDYLQIAENEKWMNQKEIASSTAQKLYLRTSGSTGTQKMVVHSDSKLMGNISNCVQRLGLKSDDRVAIPVPIFHMYGLGAAFLPAVAVGASIDLQKGANILRYLQREKEFNPNVAFMTPIFCETLLKGRKSSRTYKLTVAAGDRVREKTFAEYESGMGCLVKLYGSTEMGAIAAASPEDPSSVRAQTVGKPMPGVRMRVEKGDWEFTKEIDEVGQLWCHHEYGFEGYVDENGKPLGGKEDDRDDWFCTKDLGIIWEDGRVEVLGRCDHSVNRDGLLVLFADVEKGMETIEGIDTVVVVSKGESQRGKAIVAYCVPTKGTKITEADIRSSCFDILPKRAIPDGIIIVKYLPLLPNGKVDRQRLIIYTDKTRTNSES